MHFNRSPPGPRTFRSALPTQRVPALMTRSNPGWAGSTWSSSARRCEEVSLTPWTGPDRSTGPIVSKSRLFVLKTGCVDSWVAEATNSPPVISATRPWCYVTWRQVVWVEQDGSAEFLEMCRAGQWYQGSGWGLESCAICWLFSFYLLCWSNLSDAIRSFMPFINDLRYILTGTLNCQ